MTNLKEWEEEFARDFFNHDGWPVNEYHRTINFISSLLQAHTAEIIEMVEGMKVEHPSCYDGCPEDMDVECPISAKNQVIDDILATLRPPEGEIKRYETYLRTY